MARVTIAQLQKEIDEYIAIVKGLEDQLEKNNCVQKIKNERGAGRKERFTEHQKEVIKMYRLQGKTIREIADLYDCSPGLIHKIIKKKKL